MALKMSFCPMKQKAQFCEETKGSASRSKDGSNLLDAYDIIDDGEVDLLGSHS